MKLKREQNLTTTFDFGANVGIDPGFDAGQTKLLDYIEFGVHIGVI